MENKIQKVVYVLLFIHVALRAALLFSPLMSDIFVFEAININNVSSANFFKDIFFLKILSLITTNIFVLRSFYFLLSLVFIFLLFDVLKKYFPENNAYIWGLLFLSAPPAFFTYRSLIFTDTAYIFWILTLLLLRSFHTLFYLGGKRSSDAVKEIVLTLLLSFGYLYFFFKLRNEGSLLYGIKYFFKEMIPVYFGYFKQFRTYQEFDRVLLFLRGVHIYFLVFFAYAAIFKDKNILKLFKKDIKNTNKTEFFFLLYLLSTLFFIFSDMLESIQVLLMGFFYISFTGMFCYFMQDVYKETKYFAFILILIVVAFGVNDNKILLKKAYTAYPYKENKRTVLKLKAMNVQKVYIDGDLWKCLEFHLKTHSIKHTLLDEDNTNIEKLEKNNAVIVHKNNGVLTHNQLNRDKQKIGWSKKCSIGNYTIYQ